MPFRLERQKARTLGIDVGRKRIGLALSDQTNQIAQPLTVLKRDIVSSEIEQIGKIIADNLVTEIVVGIPISMSGKPGRQAEEVRAYLSKLQNQIDLPVKEWDERLTTALVEKVLISADLTRGRRKRIVDKLAATVILQSYLDYRRQKTED